MNKDSRDQPATVTEIAAETERQRTDGTAAALDEAEIIAAFRDLAPAGAIGDDGAAMIARLEAVAHVDIDVPTRSNRAALTPVKRVLQRSQAWYLRYVVDQINSALSLAVRSLEDHERRLRFLGAEIDFAEIGIDPSPLLSDQVLRTTVDLIGETLGDISDTHSRVLSAWSGRGEMVDALTRSGVNAYGVETVSSNVADSLQKGLDTRDDDPMEHLASVPAGSLGAVVIGSTIDLMPVAVIAKILDLSRRAVCEGGSIVVVADTNPIDPVRFELGDRSPLSPEAWLRLMEARRLPASVASSSPDDLTVLHGRR